MTPSETLRKAADVIRHNGWCRFVRFEITTGHVCALGALDRAIGYGVSPWGVEWQSPEVLAVLVKYLPPMEVRPMEGSGASSTAYQAWHVATWNNGVAKDGEEVALMMEFAALCEEEAEKLAGVTC